MNPLILNHFRDYLNEQSFNKGTITDYLRCVSNLDDPPNSKNPLAVFNYVNQRVLQEKNNFSRSGFITLRASLNEHLLSGIRSKCEQVLTEKIIVFRSRPLLTTD